MKNKMKINRFICLITLLTIYLGFESCQLFMNPVQNKSKEHIKSVSFKKTSVTLENGGSEYLTYSVNPSHLQNKVNAIWQYDKKIIEIDPDKYGVVIKSKKSGQTYLKVTIDGITATCLVTVSGNPDIYEGEPYIYSNFTVVQLTPGSNTTVSASLYGGTSTDLEDMVWTIKDPSIAELSYARGSCVITAKKTGSTQITVKHDKCDYDYSMVLYVYTDELNEAYLTTGQNIVVINKAESNNRNITVELKNPYSTSNASDYSYTVITKDGKPESFSVVGNGNTAILTAKNNGLSTLRVTHASCKYPLDILVKVTTAVENVYIIPSATTLEVTGSENSFNVYATISGTDKYADPDKFIWSVEDENIAHKLAAWESSGNCFSVKGKKNGAFKVKVSHELSEYSRSILVVLREQIESAIDTSMYITTTSNFVKTQVGANTTYISVTLMGAPPGEENNLVWTIDNGENNDICKIETPTGTVMARAAGTSTNGTVSITPLKAGKTIITITHPKILYKTEIVVKVLSEYAILQEPAYITSESLIKMLNGTTQNITAKLSGNIVTGDENGIQWLSANKSVIDVSPATGATTIITAKGSGNNQTYVSAKHEKALSEKKILVLSADTQTALNAMKGFYAETTYYRINANKSCSIELNSYGLTETDKQKIKWTTNNSSICTVSADSSNYLKAIVKGITSGKATVTASLTGCEPCSFEITVLPEGETVGFVQSNYMTTLKNAVVIPKVGNTAELSVTGINISDSDMTLFTNWVIEDPNIASITYSGGKATVTAKNKGKTKVHITNKTSENDLYIDIKVGALYEWKDDFVVYITTKEDTITMVKDDIKTIGAALENSTAKNGFSWEVTGGQSLIDIAGSASGTCAITAKEAGMAEITIRNSATQLTKQVLVIIANNAADLAGLKYLTTKQNVVTIGESYNTSVSVNIENAHKTIIDGFHWTSDNSSIINVVSSGSTAVLYGKKQGTAKITVTSDYCDYPLEIIANCVDPVLAAANPYITSQNIITLHVGDTASTVTADLIGGNESDYNNFTWHIKNNSIASLYSSNEVAQIKAVAVGTTQIVISHPKAGGIDRTVLVICEPKIKTNCYITVTESIIKMSPSDSSKTITATLVNGNANDNYNFKWWADSYDIIDMNYTSESAVITPIGTGNVTLHVSHPKATSAKDIFLQISQYSEFAFEKTATSIIAGKQNFINLQVPATSVATKVSYSAVYTDGRSAADILSVSGTKSVCILDPKAKGTCIVKAELIAVNTGIKQAESQILVNIEPAQTESTYINYAGSTIINIEKGASQKLSAFLAGVNAAAGSKVQWKSSNPSVVKLSSASNSGIFTGNEVQINALQAGKECTITIFHEDADFDVILYCIVPGENVANILLDRSLMNLIQGDSAQSLTASITNAQDKDYENLLWTVEQDENKPIIKISGSGKKISVLPEKVGTAKITATVPSSARTASCTIIVAEPKSLKLNLNSLSVYPGEEFTIKYTVSPKSETGTVSWTTSDNAFFAIAKDDKNGTLTCIGKNKEGVGQLLGTTKSKATASCNISNGWGNTLSLDKTLIKTISINNGDGTFDVKYQVKPSCAEIHIIIPQTNLEVINGTKIQNNKYAITTHEKIDSVSGIASGIIHFNPTGETNGTAIIQAYNPVSLSGGIPIGEIQGTKQEVKINASYSKLNFELLNFTTNNTGKYSRFDKSTDALFIGDGEKISFKVHTIEKNATPQIISLTLTGSEEFEKLEKRNTTETLCLAVSGKIDTYTINLTSDYSKENGYFPGTPQEDIDTEFNTSVVKLINVGNLTVNYKSTFDNQNHTYSFPCYLEIRNCKSTF